MTSIPDAKPISREPPPFGPRDQGFRVKQRRASSLRERRRGINLRLSLLEFAAIGSSIESEHHDFLAGDRADVVVQTDDCGRG